MVKIRNALTVLVAKRHTLAVQLVIKSSSKSLNLTIRASKHCKSVYLARLAALPQNSAYELDVKPKRFHCVCDDLCSVFAKQAQDIDSLLPKVEISYWHWVVEDCDNYSLSKAVFALFILSKIWRSMTWNAAVFTHSSMSLSSI